MNMISTGAFLNEMDASNKQPSTAEKFAAVWEKKNAKAARAGGVSLMALSLAACGGSSSTTTTTTTDTSTDSTTVAGTSTALTKAIDVVTGTAGDDTFIADNTVDVQANAADEIDGGAGTDTLKMYFDATNAIALPVNVSNVENLYVNDTGTISETEDFTIAALTDVTSIEIDSATTGTSTTDDARFVLTVGAGQAIVLDSVKDGADADTANETGEFEIGSAATVTSLDLTVDGVGHANTTGANTGDLDVDVAGTGVATLNATAVGNNYVGLFNTGAALTTLNISGAGLFDAEDDAVATLTTIDASANTGGVKVNITGSTSDVTITGGSGDDIIVVGADLETYDTIDGGAGTDMVVVTQSDFNAATAAVVKGANALTNVEILGTRDQGSLVIDGSKFTSINEFKNTLATTGDVAAGGAATDGINMTFEAGDVLVIGADVDGGAGTGSADAEIHGADAIELSAVTNSGTDEITIRFDAAATITGGAGAASGADDGNGGDAINAASVEVINIVTASATADVTLTAGAQASGGTVGDSIEVGANAVINLSGAGDVNLGTVAVQSAATDDITINASGMSGVLTVTTGAGNDVITGGSGADSITAGTGTNTVTGGAGKDDFVFADGASTTTAITTIKDFELGNGADQLDFAGTATYEALSAANATAIAADTTLAAATDQAATQLATDEATVFLFGGDAYALFENGGGAAEYDAAQDVLVKLEGITDLTDLDAANII